MPILPFKAIKTQITNHLVSANLRTRTKNSNIKEIRSTDLGPRSSVRFFFRLRPTDLQLEIV